MGAGQLSEEAITTLKTIAVAELGAHFNNLPTWTAITAQAANLAQAPAVAKRAAYGARIMAWEAECPAMEDAPAPTPPQGGRGYARTRPRPRRGRYPGRGRGHSHQDRHPAEEGSFPG